MKTEIIKELEGKRVQLPDGVYYPIINGEIATPHGNRNLKNFDLYILHKLRERIEK